MTFQRAACAEMLWQDRPMEWRASRLKEMGFGVGLWNWPAWDGDALEKTGADFTIMNGYLQGRLTDAEGAEILLVSARDVPPGLLYAQPDRAKTSHFAARSAVRSR